MRGLFLTCAVLAVAPTASFDPWKGDFDFDVYADLPNYWGFAEMVFPSHATLVLRAAKSGEATELDTLIADHGIDTRTRDNTTPLMEAALGGHYDATKLLLEKGAKVNVRGTQNMMSPLNIATFSGHPKIVKLLLENGAKTNLKNGDGYTPLMYAVIQNHTNIVTTLLGIGVDGDVEPSVDARSKHGDTPLLLSAVDGKTDIAQLLLEAGANINAQSDIGATALMLATARRRVDTVKMLIAKGADASLKDESDNTAEILAQKIMHWDYTDENIGEVKETLVKLLKKAADEAPFMRNALPGRDVADSSEEQHSEL